MVCISGDGVGMCVCARAHTSAVLHLCFASGDASNRNKYNVIVSDAIHPKVLHVNISLSVALPLFRSPLSSLSASISLSSLPFHLSFPSSHPPLPFPYPDFCDTQLPAASYLDRGVFENELKQVLGEIYTAEDLSAEDVMSKG